MQMQNKAIFERQFVLFFMHGENYLESIFAINTLCKKSFTSPTIMIRFEKAYNFTIARTQAFKINIKWCNSGTTNKYTIFISNPFDKFWKLFFKANCFSLHLKYNFTV